MSRTRRGIPALLLSAAISGCSLVPQAPDPALDIPPNWRHASEAAEQSPALMSGWARFGSLELTALIRRALAHNTDLQAALERINQARANARIAGAGLWPRLDAFGDLAHTRSDPGRGPDRADNAYRGQLSLAYEADLWGRNRALKAAAEARVAASAFDGQALALIVAGETARAYAGLAALNDRLGVANENLANIREVLAIVQARFDEGAASGLELAQEKAALANAQAAIAALERQRDELRNQLAVLVGQPPQTFTATAGSIFALHAPAPDLERPAALLERRPDIRRAEAELLAARIDIGVARAALFPSLQWGLDASLAADPASAPAAVAAALAAAVAAPIFQGGALEGGIELAEARRAELLADYRGTVLVAFQEVETALAALAAAGRRLSALDTAVGESRRAYELARERYLAGAIDFQTLLDTQRTLLQAQDSRVQAKLDQVIAAVDVFRAAGGDWDGTTPAPPGSGLSGDRDGPSGMVLRVMS